MLTRRYWLILWLRFVAWVAPWTNARRRLGQLRRREPKTARDFAELKLGHAIESFSVDLTTGKEAPVPSRMFPPRKQKKGVGAASVSSNAAPHELSVHASVAERKT